MSKDANTELINRFYTAFQKRDADAMNACYAPGIRFSDPVFGALEDDRAWAMWKMLAGRSAGLELTYQVGAVDDSTGNATWQAKYDFSQTGRKVDNHISSRFWFENGPIVRQEDTFDLWRWASMALGPKGQFLGWLPRCRARSSNRQPAAWKPSSSPCRARPALRLAARRQHLLASIGARVFASRPTWPAIGCGTHRSPGSLRPPGVPARPG
jgi:ketosteroid isomerase-like protein